jgi:hypothetical protein
VKPINKPFFEKESKMEINWVSTIKMKCDRCGQVKLHSMGYVGKWKEERVTECMGCGEMIFGKVKKEEQDVGSEALCEMYECQALHFHPSNRDNPIRHKYVYHIRPTVLFRMRLYWHLFSR